MSGTTAERDRLVSALEGRTCNFCGDGRLRAATYKGSDAVVCGDCEVPQVRFF